jgi:glycosyltransferase involved in cell wall biosynthesis
MPFFSVIIPTFNRADLLREALVSLAAQRFQDFEIIVIDDGSEDDIESITRACGLPLSYFRQPNSGPGAARNLGLRHARGQYITFLDSDDTWFPWTLEVFHRAIEENDGPAFLAGFGASLGEKWETAANGLEQMSTRRYPDMLRACTDRTPPVGGTPSVCVRRDVVEKAGGFAAGRINGEDTDLWLRLGCCDGFVRVLKPPIFRQRYHNSSITRRLEPSVAGAWFLLQQEKNQAYPGGAHGRRRRRRIICGTVRSVTLECLDHGRTGDAFQLYWESFWWNLGLGNLKYLAGFPVAACRRQGRRN